VQKQLQAEAAKLTATQRVKVDAALKQMKTQAKEAEQRLKKLTQTGDRSWASLNAALTQSRKAFDQASREAWEGFKKAASR